MNDYDEERVKGLTNSITDILHGQEAYDGLTATVAVMTQILHQMEGEQRRHAFGTIFKAVMNDLQDLERCEDIEAEPLVKRSDSPWGYR